MNSNRCPKCHGVANTILVDITGKRFTRCSRNTTRMMGESRLVPCELILDDRGQVFTGTIAYVSDNKVHTMGVTEGKERR
jgi:hypothetical protein